MLNIRKSLNKTYLNFIRLNTKIFHMDVLSIMLKAKNYVYIDAKLLKTHITKQVEKIFNLDFEVIIWQKI